MSPRLQQTIPILRIFSVDKAREFYLGFLGFRVAFEHRFDAASPLYMGIERDGVTLHLSEHHGDACPGAAVLVPVEGLDALHREITAKKLCVYAARRRADALEHARDDRH
jgi:catechol 2,3-dioxygenase-like lactoylglutathione lyase family enzyme